MPQAAVSGKIKIQKKVCSLYTLFSQTHKFIKWWLVGILQAVHILKQLIPLMNMVTDGPAWIQDLPVAAGNSGNSQITTPTASGTAGCRLRRACPKFPKRQKKISIISTTETLGGDTVLGELHPFVRNASSNSF